jgi:hypothetical protein
MKIILTINEDKSIKLALFDGKKEKDSLGWKDENSLSQLLLANLDKLLQKNGMGLDSPTNSSGKIKKNKNKSTKIGGGVDKISGWQIMSEVPQKWTTYRIADITLKTLNIGLSASSVDKLAKKNRVC